MYSMTRPLCVVALALMCFGAHAASMPSYDIVIRNGHVIDGTGSPWYSADIAIKDGRIAAIGRLGKVDAKQVIDAHGMVVAPGFIDMLDQSGHTLLVDGHAPSKIFQGVTTLITGEGESAAPLDDKILNEEGSHAPSWRTLGEYFKRLQSQGIAVNFGTYVGAATAREMVIGYGDRKPTADELKQMQAIVARAMRAGAFGVSTALQYPPATFSTTPELIALAKTAASYGGIYATHMRSEGNAEMAALDEVFDIARTAHIPVEIFHLKVAGHKNWGSMPEVIAKIDAARAKGLDIGADTYAYTAWGNDLASFIPPWAHAGGNAKLLERLKDPQTRARIEKDMQTPSDEWSNDWLEVPGPHAVEITSVRNPALKQFEGKRLDEVAQNWHETPIDALFDAIRKMTALPAQRMGLTQRGVIKQGMWADIDIFDPAKLRAPATFEQPKQLAQGMSWVLVNGVPVIANGKMTDALPGKVLRGPWHGNDALY